MVEENIEHGKIEGATQRLILKLKNERLNEQILKKTINEYEQIIEVVSKLTKKLNHRVIIPFSRIAFYEGSIKYTNNIYQDIGCNTYCERTAENAEKFLKKKLSFYEKKYKIISDSINRLTKEIELALELDQTSKIENENDNLNNVFLRPDGFLEIREEYHSSDEETNDMKKKKEKEKTDKEKEKEKNFKDNKELNTEKHDNNTTNKNVIDNENAIVQDKHFKRYDNEILNFEENSSKEERYDKKKETVNFNKKNKISSSKSLNVNEKGLLNIKENYSSSNSDSED